MHREWFYKLSTNVQKSALHLFLSQLHSLEKLKSGVLTSQQPRFPRLERGYSVAGCHSVQIKSEPGDSNADKSSIC